jgi:hypothetical protein
MMNSGGQAAIGKSIARADQLQSRGHVIHRANPLSTMMDEGIIWTQVTQDTTQQHA